MKKCIFILALLTFISCSESPDETYRKYNERGDLKYDDKDYLGAIAEYTKAIEISPSEAAAYCKRGNAKKKIGKHQEAIDDFSQAISKTYNDKYKSLCYVSRAISKQDLGDLGGALSDCTEAINLDPKSSLPYNSRGNVKYVLEDFKGAIDDFSKAIEIEPGEAIYRYNRGSARKLLGDTKGTCEDFKLVVDNGDTSVSNFIRKYCQ
ncbi:MAG: tetratricopeptide repeat protein [Bacteroidota bacterium]